MDFQTKCAYILTKYPENALVQGTVLSQQEYGIFLDIGEQHLDIIAFIDFINLYLPNSEDLSIYPKIGSRLYCQVNAINIDKETEKIELRLRLDETSVEAILHEKYSYFLNKYPQNILIQGIIKCKINNLLFLDIGEIDIDVTVILVSDGSNLFDVGNMIHCKVDFVQRQQRTIEIQVSVV